MVPWNRRLTTVAFVLLGLSYGLFIYKVFDHFDVLVTVAFLVIAPIAIVLFPLLFLWERIHYARLHPWVLAWVTISAFMVLLAALGEEDFLCLLFLAAPFFAIAGLVAIAFMLVGSRRSGKNAPMKATAIGLLPLVALIGESWLFAPSDRLERVEASVVITATPERIWENVTEVRFIGKEEFKGGFFHAAGVPRPLCARMIGQGEGAYRIGLFENGLLFSERIVKWEPSREVVFSIVPDTASLGDRIFERHVLGGDYFAFLSAGYRLRPLPDGRTEVTLGTDVQLRSSVNWYNAFWARWLIRDFEKRLLAVIEERCENEGAVGSGS